MAGKNPTGADETPNIVGNFAKHVQKVAQEKREALERIAAVEKSAPTGDLRSPCRRNPKVSTAKDALDKIKEKWFEQQLMKCKIGEHGSSYTAHFSQIEMDKMFSEIADLLAKETMEWKVLEGGLMNELVLKSKRIAELEAEKAELSDLMGRISAFNRELTKARSQGRNDAIAEIEKMCFKTIMCGETKRRIYFSMDGKQISEKLASMKKAKA